MQLSRAWHSVRSAASLPVEAGLEARLTELVARAREAHPFVSAIDDEQFVRYVAERAPESSAAERSLEKLHVDDLYLACACQAGELAALRAFESRYGAEIVAASARVAPEAADDIGQRVREKLFMEDRLVGYAGTGPLGAWLHAVVARTALEWKRLESNRPPAAGDGDLTSLVDAEDPELAQFRNAHTEAFKQAFQRALATLTVHERTVLRWSLLDGLSAAQIAVAERVHRVTVVRWLSVIRTRLLETTRTILIDQLSLTPSDFGTVTAFCLREIDLSLTRMLKDE